MAAAVGAALEIVVDSAATGAKVRRATSGTPVTARVAEEGAAAIRPRTPVRAGFTALVVAVKKIKATVVTALKV
jgi:hypothetical protein